MKDYREYKDKVGREFKQGKEIFTYRKAKYNSEQGFGSLYTSNRNSNINNINDKE